MIYPFSSCATLVVLFSIFHLIVGHTWPTLNRTPNETWLTKVKQMTENVDRGSMSAKDMCELWSDCGDSCYCVFQVDEQGYVCVDVSSWEGLSGDALYGQCANRFQCSSSSQCPNGEICGGFLPCEDYYCFPLCGASSSTQTGPCETLSTSTSCKISDPSNGLTQQIAEQCVDDGHLTELPSEYFSCADECSLYLSPRAARSLIQIAEQRPRHGMIIERAFESVAERYLTDRFNEIGCSNKERKVINEEPVVMSHQSGCAIDIAAGHVGFWHDALISKGWTYTRPTIYTHHFEFLKCDDVEADCRASYVNFWNNNNLGSELASSNYDQNMINSLGTLSCEENEALPTSPPTSGQSTFYCPSYSASDTDAANVNYQSCSIYACGGSIISMSVCDTYCSDDTYLRLYDGSGNQVAYNDDYCGLCSQIDYQVESNSACQAFELREGCFDDGYCEGQVLVTITPYSNR